MMPSQPSPCSSDAGVDSWRCCEFSALSAHDLQNIYAARQAVFVLEQQCFYQDIDGMDDQAWHLAAWRRGQHWPLAYARLFPPGVKYPEASIGRVLTTQTARGSGMGRELVRRAIEQSHVLFPGQAMRISAQAHLKNFYQAFGFLIQGDAYLEDGIPHLDMRLPPDETPR